MQQSFWRCVAARDNSRPWQLAAARAHRTTGARARQGLLEKPSPSCLWHDTPPRGEARLGSPFGGAVAVRRLRGQPASASTQPMRGGRWQLALSVLANASPPPPKGEARLGFAQAFGGAHTWLHLWGPLRPGGTLPSGRSPLPRRSALDVCHWQTAPEPAGESALQGRAERVSRWLAAQLLGSCLLGAPPSGKNASLFP